jgi:Patched family
VKDALQTMGSSVVVGGLSTFLGVVPLIFSQSDLMKALFFGFWGMVLLGLSHGVILLPVILSYVGPLNTTPENAVPTGTYSEHSGDEATDKVGHDSLRSPSSVCQTVPTSEASTRHHLNSDGDLSQSSCQKPGYFPPPVPSEVHHAFPQGGSLDDSPMQK